MASLETPKTWIPYVNSKDCSKGFCSLYCPQWCYIIFPPPPPPPNLDYIIDTSTPTTFSPLLIAIIGVLASAFLLISYYTIISKYCGRRGQEEEGVLDETDDDQQNHNNSSDDLHEAWQVSSVGLDEALIKRIRICKYKKGDGLIEVKDCCVCLNEFQEDESLRLLPKCSHAFHVSCIDTWLKSHSNCPLCRANIVFIPPPPPVVDGPQSSLLQDGRPGGVSEERLVEIIIDDDDDDDDDEGQQHQQQQQQQQRVRRSFSMDHNPCFERRASIADMLRMNDEDEEVSSEEDGSSVEARKSGRRRRKRRDSNGVNTSPVCVSMERSFSSGRFFLSGRPGTGRVRDTITICLV